MARPKHDFIYREEFAQPGEGPGNAQLLVDCMWAVLGFDPKIICREVTRKEREKSRGQDVAEEIRKLAAGL